MKVTAIKTFFCRGDAREYFIVKVETDAGLHGLGEAGIVRWAGAIDHAVRHLADLVIGEDPFATERLWQRMFRGGFFPADRVYCCAISAIDIALWDIKGKATGMPVHKLLGGPVRDEVVCYPHVGGRDTAELVANCQAAVAEGWRFLRWDLPFGTTAPNVLNPRESVALAVERMAAVRAAVGDETGLCLDVHTRIGTADAIDLCRRLAPLQPFFVEDPLRSENPASYRTLERHVDVPIAAGEQWASKWSFREVIEEELVRYARIDLCIVGGLTEALKITHWCETHGNRHRAAQPARPGERRGRRRPLHGLHQRRGARDATGAWQRRHRSLSRASAMAARLRGVPRPARPWRGVQRTVGADANRRPSRLAAATAQGRWRVQQLVKAVRRSDARAAFRGRRARRARFAT